MKRYKILNLPSGTWLLRDDGYRFHVMPLEVKAVNIPAEWHFLMEYKQFDWPGIAGQIADYIMQEPAPSGEEKPE